MWFKDWTKKVVDKTKSGFTKVTDFSARKISESSSVSIKTPEDLEKFIEKSKTTEHTNEKTWETKQFQHKVALIVADEKSDFYKRISLEIPILKTKWFAWNIPVKLAKKDLEWIDFSKFSVKEYPTMLIFQEEQVLKQIIWEENIEKISKSLTINMNELIEQI